jgi:hypothetical protein
VVGQGGVEREETAPWEGAVLDRQPAAPAPARGRSSSHLRDAVRHEVGHHAPLAAGVLEVHEGSDLLPGNLRGEQRLLLLRSGAAERLAHHRPHDVAGRDAGADVDDARALRSQERQEGLRDALRAQQVDVDDDV